MPGAIITGAGSGIGRATALELASRGFSIALVGRRRAPLEQTAAQVRALGDGLRAEVIVADVSLPDQAREIIGHAAKVLDSVHALVNAVGAVVATPLASCTDEQWRLMLDANLSSAFFTTRAVWPIMETQHRACLCGRHPFADEFPGLPTGGAIINISSRAVRDPFAGLAAYAAAKSGLSLLTLMSAREGEPAGIRALCIAPGAVETQMLRGLVDEKALGGDEVLSPSEVAATIGDAIIGSLRIANGETLFLHKHPA